MLLCFLVLAIFIPCGTAEPDPCLSSESSILLDDGGRSSVCSLYYNECDAYIREGWYQVITEQDGPLTMPTTCIDMFNCGTAYPVWMNGTLPTVSEGIVNRTACVSTTGNCCDHSYGIRVKNCTYYYVYYLTRCQGCTERYCFGDSSICPTTTTAKPTTTTVPTSTTTTSTLPSSASSISTMRNLFPTKIVPNERVPTETLCPSSFVFMALSACLMGTTVGLAVNVLLRYRKDRRVEDFRRDISYPNLKETYKS